MLALLSEFNYLAQQLLPQRFLRSPGTHPNNLTQMLLK
jgi:hypothetical protein